MEPLPTNNALRWVETWVRRHFRYNINNINVVSGHSLPPVLRSYMFLGVRQCSVVTTQHAEKTPYSRHSVFTCSLLCFMIHRSGVWVRLFGRGQERGLLLPILSALRTVGVSLLIEPP